ncbi:MAG: DUF5916 domain-containing protein [Chitinophagaceae bacterium]
MLKKIGLCIYILLTVISVFAQTKSLHAVKVNHAPKMDGTLNDSAWKQAPSATNFIINFPDFGKPSSQKSEVKILYDDNAIYVGAHLYDDPSLIKKQFTTRDNEQRQDVDNFGIAFDTYKDKQNAFEFIVTAANVQSDVRISSTLLQSDNDNGDNGGFDYNWDAVWDSKTSIVKDGWIAEIKIPFSALRFSKKDVQDWGVNFSRYIRRLNEQSYWNPVDPKIDGFVNQFGDLDGLQNLTPPLRLSFLPYISAGYSTVPTNSGTINQFLHHGGMDVKYGVNESFTLDMTLIPDFGQVQSDNVILNLSPFEQQYAENRPFFTEGTELFNKAGIFYSRRIGETPVGYYNALQLAADSNYAIIKNPSLTQLYNATKFSGRTKYNLGIGLFNAITAPMYAELKRPDGSTFKYQTEPLTNYNIVVLDQALKNRSYITFTNTNVIRSDTSRNADVVAFDLSLFDKKNIYNFLAKENASFVGGFSPHNGFRSNVDFQKVSGKWQWDLYNDIKSQYYDVNDLGILREPNQFISGGDISFNQFEPNKIFNLRKYNINIEESNLLAPFSFEQLNINGDFLHVFKNFWDITFHVESHPIWENDYFELRVPGRFLKRTPFTYFGFEGSTDSRKKLFVKYSAGYGNLTPVPNDPFYLSGLGARYRFNDKFSLELDGERQDDNGNFGAVLDINGNPVIINDSSVIGIRHVTQFTSTLIGDYNFKARMNLSLRVRHYWSKVQYLQFYNVKSDGYWNDRNFINGEDENFNAFNLDMFFTWDFRLGSRLIVAWKNALGPDINIDGSLHEKYFNNVGALFNVSHSNEITVKFIYYLDYQQLTKKKS